MSKYTQLLNNFDSIGLLTFRNNLDGFIDRVNKGEQDVVDGLFELTEKE